MNKTFTFICSISFLFFFSVNTLKAQTVCCPLPINLVADSVSSNFFCVRWRVTDSVACDTPHAGTLQYKPVGTTTWTTVQVSYSYPYFYATKCDTAMPCTKYQWRVRNKCVTSDSTVNTAWVAGPRFTTNCDSTDPRTAGAVHIYPNPARNSITVNVAFPQTTEVKIVVADVHGNQKLQKEVMLLNNVLRMPVDISTWNKGIYFITIIEGKRNTRYSFIKE